MFFSLWFVPQEFFGADHTLHPFQTHVMEAMRCAICGFVQEATGGGKSVTFWLPALKKWARVLVIAPTRTLMMDQTDALRDLWMRVTGGSKAESEAFIFNLSDPRSTIADLKRSKPWIGNMLMICISCCSCPTLC
jgi:hypothetical protein